MRNAFADEVFKMAQEDDRVVLLSGDIGNKLFDKFKIFLLNIILYLKFIALKQLHYEKFSRLNLLI